MHCEIWQRHWDYSGIHPLLLAKASHEYGDLINSCINSGTHEYDFRFAPVLMSTIFASLQYSSRTSKALHDYFFASSVLMILIAFCEYKNMNI